MAEEAKISPKIILTLFLVGCVLLGWYLVRRGGSGGGILRIEPSTTNSASAANTNGSGDVRGAVTQALCEVRPAQDFGACRYFLAVYFDGSSCRQVFGCSLRGERPPFFDLGACHAACEIAK